MIWLLAAEALAVEVVVRDKADGDPIPGATLRSGDLAVTTDPDGRAELALTGSATVEVDAEGFAPATVEIALPVDVAKIWLAARPEGFEVVIEGLRPTPHPTRHAIDAEQAYETPGVLEDAGRLVQALPGAAVQREYGPAAGDLWVRGSAPRDSRIYLDGVEVPYLYHYNQYASVFPASQVGQMELFPSAFGPAYGDAVGAIVEARSKTERPDAVHGSVHGSFVMGGADVRAPIEDGWVSVAARRSYFDVAGESSRQYPKWPRFYDGSARLELGDEDRGTGFFVWGAGDGYTRAAGELDALDPVEDTLTPSLDYARAFQIAGVRHHWDAGDQRGRVVVAGVFSQNEATLSQGGREALEEATGTSRLDVQGAVSEDLGWEAGWELRAGRTQLEVEPGGDDAVLVAEEGPSLARGAAVDDALARARVAGYAGLAWSPGDLRLMPGARLSFDSAGAAVMAEPRLGARYTPGESTALKVGGGRYQQRPDADLLIAVPELPTTSSWQVSGGVEQAVAGRLELGVDAWRKWLEDPLVVPVDALPFAGDAGDAYGLELTTRYRLRERFFLWGWLSLTKSTVTVGPRTFASDGDQPVAGGVVASLDTGPWSFGLRYRYGSGLPWTPVRGSLYDAGDDAWSPIPAAENSGRYPAYQKVDARVGRAWDFRGWSLSTTLEVWYVPKSSAQLFPVWSYDYREQGWVIGPTVLPLLSARATF